LVSEEQLTAIVAYVKSLTPQASGAAGTPSLISPGKQPQEPKQ
jgi:hypothetical protein